MYIAISLIILLLGFTLAYFKFRIVLLKEYTSSLLGSVKVWKKYNGELLLTTNGFAQGISTKDKSITKSYWYYQAQKVTDYAYDKKNVHVLWLGLGAGAGPHIVAEALPELSQTVIEFDPIIIQADKEFFGLDKIKNLTVIQSDAYEEIKSFAKQKKQFDVIVNDIYINADMINGKKSSDNSFLGDVITCLKPEGLLLFNRLAQNDEYIRSTEKLMPYLEEYFQTVTKHFVKDPRIYRNEIISAVGKK